MAFLSAMMYTTSVHSESTKFQVHLITSSILPQSSTSTVYKSYIGSARLMWSWAGLSGIVYGTPGARRRAWPGAPAPAPVRSPVRAGLPGCPPVSALLVLRQLRTRYTVPGRCSLLSCTGEGQREAGGGRVGIAARRARGGGLFFASESAAAGFGHRVAWSRRAGVAARA